MSFEGLKGEWKGYYKYGRGYSRSLRGKKETFTITIQSHDTIFSGICMDWQYYELNEKQFPFLKDLWKTRTTQP
jgi:hypothetical protein